jgi:hypothetical protein
VSFIKTPHRVRMWRTIVFAAASETVRHKRTL